MCTDNKPLISFFDRSIDKVPMRIQRWLLSLQPFDFDVQHISGKNNVIANCLSRYPNKRLPMDEEECSETICFVLNDSLLTEEEVLLFTNEDQDL